jgi:hypothetical protein
VSEFCIVSSSFLHDTKTRVIATIKIIFFIIKVDVFQM